MVIFGAGASFDSVDPANFGALRMQFRPPLTNRLFTDEAHYDEALDLYPQFSGLITWLRGMGRDEANLEQELGRLRDRADGDDGDRQALVQLAAIRYYLRRILFISGELWAYMSHGGTNYATLLERIRRWHIKSHEPVVLVTFNYDTLLEKAAGNVLGLLLTDVDSFTSNDEYKIFKMHGSVDWAQVVTAPPNAVSNIHNPVGVVERQLIEATPDLTYTHEYHRNTIGLPFDRYAYGPFGALDFPKTRENSLLFPAIAIPLEAKTDFECPLDHQNQLVQIFRDVSKLLIIGWRGAEQHFLRLALGNLPNRIPTQVIADGSGHAQQTWENLVRGASLVGEYQPADRQGFTNYLLGDELERFLK
jgi:hypothetical protein